MDNNNMPPVVDTEPANAHLFPSQKARIEALWESKFLLDGRESKSIVAQSKGGSVTDMMILSEYILNGTGELEKAEEPAPPIPEPNDPGAIDYDDDEDDF